MSASRNPRWNARAATKRGVVLPSLIEQLEPYVTKASALSEYFLHYAFVEKVGLYPKSFFQTPLGIYAYPLTDYVFRRFKLGRLPYGAGSPLLALLRVVPDATVLHSDPDLAESDLVRLTQKAVHLDWGRSDGFAAQLAAAARRNAQVATNLGQLWNVTRLLSSLWQEIARYLHLPVESVVGYPQRLGRTAGADWAAYTLPPAPKAWSALWLRLGIDGVNDNGGLRIIHENESVQTVFFHKGAVEVVDMFRNTMTPEGIVRRQRHTHAHENAMAQKVSRNPNVVNTQEVDAYLATHSSTMPPAAQKWVQSTLRKWLLNEAPVTQVRDPEGLPGWAVQALDRSEPLLEVQLSDPRMAHRIENVLDWLRADPDVARKHVLHMTVLQAEGHAADYRNRRAKAPAVEGEVAIVRGWNDGWKLVRLLDAQAFQREGQLMKHCVGDELRGYYTASQSGQIHILSLRDPQNQPHATVEVHLDSRRVAQIKGKANGPIKQQYTKYLQQWLNDPEPYRLETIEDLNNIGILVQGGKWYSIYHLPAGFQIDGSLDLRVFMSELTELPDLSAVIVNRDFSCGGNRLTNLIGAPQTVHGDFDCSETALTSLVGAPSTVDGEFSCHNNRLTSLAGAPRTVGGSFCCSYNPITSLVGAPRVVGLHLFCNDCQLTSLAGAPQMVGGDVFLRWGNPRRFTEAEVRAVIDVKGKVHEKVD